MRSIGRGFQVLEHVIHAAQVDVQCGFKLPTKSLQASASRIHGDKVKAGRRDYDASSIILSSAQAERVGLIPGQWLDADGIVLPEYRAHAARLRRGR